MTTESSTITVPDLGGAENVEVIELLVKAGDKVDSEQSVVTLETDKASMEIPAGQSGVVQKVLLALGDKVSMGDAMLEMAISEDADETVSETPEHEVKAAEKEPTEKEPTEKEPTESRMPEANSEVASKPVLEVAKKSNEVHAGPAVRRLARELGVDLSAVQGTGGRDRITRDDVQDFVKEALNNPSSNMPRIPEIDFSKFGEIERQPLNKIKRVTARNMTAAWLNVPHVTQFDEANITELEGFRKQLNAQQSPQVGSANPKLSIVPFVMKALASAMKKFPQFNSSLAADGQSLIYKKYIHIGVAVDTPNGLLVPVVRDVDKKSVMEIALDLNDKAEKARQGTLGLADMQGGCISVSSLGGIGGSAFTPIVNAPEVAILGLSRAQIRPLWQANEKSSAEEGEFIPVLMLPLSLSYDHRVIDGAEAARFCQFLVAVLSDIRRLVL